MEDPFFIVGASRSGTTMLRLMLNAHSRIAVPNELKYFNMLPSGVAPRAWRDPGLTEEEYAAFVRRFLARRRFMFEGLEMEAMMEEMLSNPDRDLRTPYRIAAEAWTRRHGKRRWGEKTPENLYYVDVLMDMFPTARFIYLARDPRAVVRSMNAISYFSGDTVINALNWRLAATRGDALLEASVPSDRRMTVRYEDVVAETETQLRRICDFLGEAFEPSMLEFHRSSEKYMGPEIRTPTVRQAVDVRHAEKWKQELSRSEIGVIESICRDPMKRFGYEASGYAPGPAGRLETWLKVSYWKLLQWRRRHKRPTQVSFRPLERTRMRVARLLRLGSVAGAESRSQAGS